jgi:hypothetical protein
MFGHVPFAGKKMAAYRVCVLSDEGQVVEEKVIQAIRNHEAIELAERLLRSMTIKGRQYEVWLGDRRILHKTLR